MPIGRWTSTEIYLLVGLFLAPPFRRQLEAALEGELERCVVAAATLIAWFVNEGLPAPPIAGGPWWDRYKAAIQEPPATSRR